MTINKRIDYLTSILMHKTINKSSPNYLHSRFEYVEDKHQINTRSAANGKLFIAIYKLFSRQGKDLTSTREYMLGTVYLWTLENTT